MSWITICRIGVATTLAVAVFNLGLKLDDGLDALLTQACLVAWIAMAWFWFERAEGRR